MNNTIGILIVIMLACNALSLLAFAETYQWTDDNGVVHFTDNAASIPKKGVIKRNDASSASQTEEKPSSREITAANQKEKIQDSVHYDAGVEQELRDVWNAYNDAFFRKDANAAAEYIRWQHRDYARKLFGSIKNLRSFSADRGTLKLRDLWDEDTASCIIVREENVKGKMESVAYPVIFYKENGKWKIDKP